MRIHYLQHISFEGLGSMENFFVAKGSQLSRTCMYADQSLPSIHEIDALIIMGGPMGVYDEAQYPWLVLEKEFIESVVQRKIPVFGVCLGAQLIASVLGASVQKNHQEEIGWFPVERKYFRSSLMLCIGTVTPLLSPVVQIIFCKLRVARTKVLSMTSMY